VGSRSLFESFERAQADGFLSEYRLIGYATTSPTSDEAPGDPQYLGNILEQIPELARHGVTNIVAGAQTARDPQVMNWMIPCLQRGCRVTNEAVFYETATGQILVDEITPSWFLFADLKVHCDRHATVKRAFDVLTAGLGLMVTAPLWPLIALAIKLGDWGNVFYYQDRVGQNGEIFRLYKFRTMRPDAENGRSVWASPNDPRVTRVGRVLRKTRLDELPQLYNVLIGQMSIVGPRPERPDIVRELCDKVPYYAERHLVKPGITGWAQISFRYGASVEDARRKLQFDLYYLKNMSFELDLIILFRTLGTFLRGAC
jgi:exopolysaccharide biosynthesis polyprenyl glycosylphosphotransferase